mmetsp:Transcript_43664/g.120861  ORF Transcript_43664/g.120861 Transcript_43664/m.120861 type:complete len:266 (+) Transcript_43664:800-1597(+)
MASTAEGSVLRSILCHMRGGAHGPRRRVSEVKLNGNVLEARGELHLAVQVHNIGLSLPPSRLDCSRPIALNHKVVELVFGQSGHRRWPPVLWCGSVCGRPRAFHAQGSGERVAHVGEGVHPLRCFRNAEPSHKIHAEVRTVLLQHVVIFALPPNPHVAKDVEKLGRRLRSPAECYALLERAQRARPNAARANSGALVRVTERPLEPVHLHAHVVSTAEPSKLRHCVQRRSAMKLVNDEGHLRPCRWRRHRTARAQRVTPPLPGTV